MSRLLRNLVGNKRFVTLLMLMFVLTLSASDASAHAKLLRSQPADAETLREPPKIIELTFSGELQSGSMNSIVVTDNRGTRIDKNIVLISEDGKRIQTELDALSDGDYTVEWKTLSADEHSIKGKFTFKIALVANSNAASGATPELPTSSDKMRMDHQMPAQESGTNWVQSAARWLMYLAMMTPFGGFAFRLLVLTPALEQARDLSDEERAFAFGKGENRFFRLTGVSLALLAVTVFASLVLQTAAVLDVGIMQAFVPSRLFQVLTETSFGLPWLLQATATPTLSIIVFFMARSRRNDESGQIDLNGRATILWIGLALCAMLFLTPCLTGHARAAVKEYPFAIFSDWVHLVAVGVWVGGLFHLALTVPGSIAHLSSSRRLCVLSRVIPLFSRLAIGSSILIALTGIYNSWIHVESFSALLTTPYGQVLSIKIILFLPMIVLGGSDTFVLHPRAARFADEAVSADDHQKTDRSFSRVVRVEAMVGSAVLLLAAILAFLPPARQHEMMMSDDQSSNPGNFAKPR